MEGAGFRHCLQRQREVRPEGTIGADVRRTQVAAGTGQGSRAPHRKAPPQGSVAHRQGFPEAPGGLRRGEQGGRPAPTRAAPAPGSSALAALRVSGALAGSPECIWGKISPNQLLNTLGENRPTNGEVAAPCSGLWDASPLPSGSPSVLPTPRQPPGPTSSPGSPRARGAGQRQWLREPGQPRPWRDPPADGPQRPDPSSRPSTYPGACFGRGHVGE